MQSHASERIETSAISNILVLIRLDGLGVVSSGCCMLAC